MLLQSLTGTWMASHKERGIEIPGVVPGNVYYDLLQAGQIPDPYYRDNEKQAMWVGESGWTFTRDFVVDEALLGNERVLLRCYGLDTLATIIINGKRFAMTDNMHRTWEFDVKRFLLPGTNSIRIDFASPRAFIEKKGKKQRLYGDTFNMGHIRKQHCNFGWDWGVKTTTSGIWRDIELVAFDLARIVDVEVRQAHGDRDSGCGMRDAVSGKGRSKSENRKLKAENVTRDTGCEMRDTKGVRLSVGLGVERVDRSALVARVLVSLKGKTVASDEVTFRGKQTVLEMMIEEPQLWWPNGMGDQPLYEVKVELLDKSGLVIDRQTKRIGLRTLALDRHKDQWGESFQFVV